MNLLWGHGNPDARHVPWPCPTWRRGCAVRGIAWYLLGQGSLSPRVGHPSATPYVFPRTALPVSASCHRYSLPRNVGSVQWPCPHLRLSTTTASPVHSERCMARTLLCSASLPRQSSRCAGLSLWSTYPSHSAKRNVLASKEAVYDFAPPKKGRPDHKLPIFTV